MEMRPSRITRRQNRVKFSNYNFATDRYLRIDKESDEVNNKTFVTKTSTL